MADLTLRLVKGSPVTFEEMDSNLLALDSDSPFRVAAGHIGYNGKVVLGLDGDSPGYVPSYDLDFGYGSITNTFSIGGSTDININVDTNKEFRIITDGQERFTVLGNGNIGIGNTTPNQPLEVNGNIQSNATVIANQGFFQSFYDGFMTIVGGSIFGGINADFSGQVTFGTLNDGAVPPMVAFEIDALSGSSVILPASSAIKFSLDSEVNVLNLAIDSDHQWANQNFDSEHQFNIDQHDSEHAWAVANFDSEHNWANANFDSEHQWANQNFDSEHNWTNTYITNQRNQIDSLLDSEHAWNIAEHNQLQANIDSEHSYTLAQVNLLNDRVDSEHAWANTNFDSEHNYNRLEHQQLQANIDSDHLWALRNFDSEHAYAVNLFDSEHFWAKRYIEAGDSVVDSELKKQIRIQDANMDSEHAWNIAEHGELQQNIDSDHDWAVLQFASQTSGIDSEHAWNVQEHLKLDSNIDSDHRWAAQNFDSDHFWARDNFDSEHNWANANFDSEHAWNVQEHLNLDSNIDSDHAWAVANFDSDHFWARDNFDSEHTWARDELDSIYTDLSARADSEHAWNVAQHDSDHAWAVANFDSEHTWARDNFDSEHAWNVTEHTTLQNNIDSDVAAITARLDSEHGYDVSQNLRLDQEIDSDHAWASAKFDSEHSWNIAEHNALQVDIDSVYSALQNLSGGAYTSVDGDSDAKHAISGGNGITYSSDTGVIAQTAQTINTVSYNGTAPIVVEPFVERDDATAATRKLVFVDDATAGHKRLNMDNDLSYNPSTNTLTATTFAGNATTASALNPGSTINTVAYNGTAAIVVEPFVERDDATNANRLITFVDNNTAGHKRLNMDTNLTYNPSTNVMATSVSGSAATAAALSPGSTINTVLYTGAAAIVVEPFVERDDTTNANRLITFVDNNTAGHKRLNMDTNLTYNPSTNIMATSISGNAATATILQTARTINTVSFNGSANIVVEPFVERDDATNASRPLTFVDNTTAGHKRLNMDANLLYNPSTNTLTATNFAGTATRVANDLNFDGTIYNGSAAVTITTINGGTFP